MKFEADPKQRLLVLSMMFGETAAEREPTLGVVSKRLLAEKRNPLVQAGICKIEKRGRAQHLLLDKGATQFVLQNLGLALPASPSAAKVLTQVLGRLKSLTEDNEMLRAQLWGGAAMAAASTAAPKVDKAVEPQRATTEAEIREACLSLAGGQIGKRVRLAELRERVPASRRSVDDLLKAMQQAGRLVLFKMDNPAEITADDERAALIIAGHPRHLVYLEA